MQKKTEVKQKYDLIIGKQSIDIFNYYNVDKLHGLSKLECIEYDETKKDVYIAGLCNWSPHNPLRAFVFINTYRFNNTHEDVSLVYHEMMHLSLRIHGWKSELEEEIITFAEQQTNDFFKIYNI